MSSGCASLDVAPDLFDVPELADVPFYPQTDFDCGPAALATILNTAGVPVTPAELLDAVYVEGLQGSLQVELLGATRRYELLPIPITPDPLSLLTEVSSGRPVLVLQNLRLTRAPMWHYAVVVGYSAERASFVLRSGDQQRRMERASRFLRSWHLADYWGFVAVAPGEIPTSTTPDIYMRALVGSAGQLDMSGTEHAYAAALERWPNDSLVLFLTASWEQARANLEAAAKLYRRLIELEPEHAAARNNLANVLLAQGCRDEALREAQLALGLQSPNDGFYSAIAGTIREIEASPVHGVLPCS
jgi:hypothetical protein